MRTFRTHIRTLALSSMLAAAPFGFAQAQTPQAAIDRFEALVEELGLQMEWTGVRFAGSDAVLVGVTVGSPDAMAPIGDVTLTGISEVDNGFRVEAITLQDYQIDEGDISCAAAGIRLGGVILPNEGQQDALGGFMFYETANVDSVNVDVQGVEVFTLTDAHFEVTPPEGGNPMTTTGAVESFTVDLSLVEDSNQRAVIQALGYEQIRGYMQMEGTWQPSDGRMVMPQFAVTVVDAGTIDFNLDISGYTPAFIASLRDLQKQMAANPGGDSSTQGLAILGLMQQLTFNNARIGFTDDSLTNRVLEFVSKSQGVTPTDLKNQAKAVLPFVLAQLNNPDLTSSATQAVSAFLDDPQSLWISAEPQNPVPFALIAAEAMSAPQGLIKTLGVKVTANE